DGVRCGDGVVRGRGVRRPGVREGHLGGRTRASARLQRPGALRSGRPDAGAMTDRYAAAGVRFDAAEEAKRRIASLVRTTRMTLAGGETAQLPDLYQPGQYDLAGTIVGVVEERKALHGDLVRPGDVLIGYASNGLHTNGYTLARRIVFERLRLDVHDEFPETGRTVAQVLLDVHRSYVTAVSPVLARL